MPAIVGLLTRCMFTGETCRPVYLATSFAEGPAEYEICLFPSEYLLLLIMVVLLIIVVLLFTET